MAITNRNIKDEPSLNQEAERQALIAGLESTEPQTKLGAKLLSLRLKMLREGQQLSTIDEINLGLGRDRNEDLY